MVFMEFGNRKLSYLKENEILDPFIVLKEMFKKHPSCESIQDEFWELITVAFRRNYWMQYKSPKVIYQKYLKMTRLFEAGLLIAKIRPSYTIRHNFIIENKSFELAPENSKAAHTQTPLETAYLELLQWNDHRCVGEHHFEMMNILYHALEATILNYADWFEYTYSFHDKFSRLIFSLFTIFQSERDFKLTKSDKKILRKYKNDALDSNTPQFQYDDNFGPYAELLNPEYNVCNDLIYLRDISFKRSYWSINGNPGNVLRYFDEFQYLLETFIEFHEILEPEEKQLEWDIPENFLKGIKYFPKEHLKFPLNYLDKEIHSKPLHVWRDLLESWKLDALEGASYNILKYESLESLLFSLIEFTKIQIFMPGGYNRSEL